MNCKILYLYSPVRNDIFLQQRCKFIDFELRFNKKKNKKNKKMKNMAKMWKGLFEILCISYITDQPNFVYWLFSHILYLDIIKSEINFKLKVKMNEILIYGFQWG